MLVWHRRPRRWVWVFPIADLPIRAIRVNPWSVFGFSDHGHARVAPPPSAVGFLVFPIADLPIRATRVNRGQSLGFSDHGHAPCGTAALGGGVFGFPITGCPDPCHPC